LPNGARKLQALVEAHQALLIATPEYNGGYTALLKNAVDWISRPRGDGSSGVALLAGKAAALVSASPGQLGGLRSQTGMRAVLDKLGMLVVRVGHGARSIRNGWAVEGQQRHAARIGRRRGVVPAGFAACMKEGWVKRGGAQCVCCASRVFDDARRSKGAPGIITFVSTWRRCASFRWLGLRGNPSSVERDDCRRKRACFPNDRTGRD
jgi:hypothetical protein